jgi:hypothetical protein
VIRLFTIGVCSECESDLDCTRFGRACEPPLVDLDNGLFPAICI